MPRPPRDGTAECWDQPSSGKSSSGCLDDLVRLETARADVDPPAGRALLHPDLLQVRVEAPPGRDHRVASGVPEGGLLAAAVAYAGHGPDQASGPSLARGRLRDQRHPRHGERRVAPLVPLVAPR